MQWRRYRYRLAAAAIGLICVALLVWQGLQTEEPMYEGLPLTVWLDRYDENFMPMDDTLPTGDAYAAIREIGTNGIPTLISLIESKNLSTKWRAKKWELKRRFGVHVHRGPEFRNQRLAWSGFAALGSNAAPAVPRLIELLNHRKPSVRAAAAMSLGYIGPAADDAVLPLAAQITNAEYRVRSNAVWALGAIGRSPEYVVPIFLNILNESDQSDPLVCDTLAALSKFKNAANSAIPRMQALSESQNYSTRWWANEALRRIGALTNAPSKE